MTFWSKDKENLRPLWIFLTVYALLFFWLAWRKYSLFAYDTTDTAIFVHAFWATLHGKFFWNYSLGMCFFGDHAGLVLLALIPFYAAFPFGATLLFLQSAFIALAGVPIYLIARKALGDSAAALCMVAAFLISPPIVSQHVNQIHDTQFIIAVLLFSFWFYYLGSFRWFAVFLMLSCLGKENVPLTLLMFSVYAALQRRPWKWIVTPVVVSGTALYLLFGVVLPHFRGDLPYRSFAYFGALGDTPLQVLRTVITEPSSLISALVNIQNILYLIQLAQPAGWILPFLSWPAIFVLPDLLLNLIADNSALKVLRWHYNVTIGAFLFVGVIFSARRLTNWLTQRYGTARYNMGFSVLLVCLSAAHWLIWFDVNEYRAPTQYRALRSALDMIPSEASILVPPTVLAHVAGRWHFATVRDWLVRKKDPQGVFHYKYVIIDANETHPQWRVPAEVIKAYLTHSDYRLAFNQDRILVFERLGPDPMVGREPIKFWQIDNRRAY